VRARSYSLADRLLGEIGKAINVLGGSIRAERALPESAGGELVLDEADRAESARLMRVNHAGEVAAQALYRGQVLAAREESAMHTGAVHRGTAAALRQAAAEELDHLAWCEQRIAELGGRSSLLNPLWYAGSFLIGSVAGGLGDSASLGFLSETERQVESHLHSHLERLPAADRRSRAIVEQMKRDEAAHGAKAQALGAAQLPAWLKAAMHLSSRLMTKGSYWI
jgi:3-demethoxyubiquinol 3-hydroxylase